MNVLRSTPCVLALESCCRPEPSTNRNSSGCTSEVTIRMRSLLKRISSRSQTIFTARSSLRHDARRDADPNDLASIGAHRRPPAITCIATRLRAVALDSSASRIVLPV